MSFDFSEHPDRTDAEEESHSKTLASEPMELVERSKALAVMGPLVKLLAQNLSGPAGLLDTNTLSMSAISHLIDGLRLMNLSESSLTAHALSTKIAADIGKQFTALVTSLKLDSLPPSKEVKEIAEMIVDQLLARKYRGIFSTDIFHSATGFENFEFRLVEEYDNPEGDILIRPTAACTNLYLNALGQPLSDMQTALAAIIDRQIRRGDFAMAEKTAIQHRALTHQHLVEVRLLRRRIESNVRQVSWREQLRPELDRLDEELPPLIDNDDKLYDNLVGNIDVLTGPKGSLARKVLSIIEECRDTYRDIWVIAKGLRRLFSDAIVKQGLFANYTTLPVLEEEVLKPALMLPDAAAIELAEQGLLAAMGGVRRVVVQDLSFILDRLLMPRHDSSEVLDDLMPPVLEPLESTWVDLYPTEVFENVNSLIDGMPREGALLSNLAEEAEKGSLPIETCQLLALVAQKYWSEPQNAGLDSAKTGLFFIGSHVSGDDFHLMILG